MLSRLAPSESEKDRSKERMYKQIPHESWFQKGIRATEQGLQIYGVAKGVYEAGSAIAGGVRSAYQVAAPLLALL